MFQRLLFADDSLTMHRVVEITFAREEITLVAAYSGAEALKLAAQEPLDGALVDMDLGDMDGYALCEQLIAQQPTPLPVLLLGSDQHPVDLARARAAGAVGAVKKPFDTQSLVARVHAALQEQPAPHEAEGSDHTPPPPPPLPERPAFFATPPPLPPGAIAQTMAPEHTNPWTVQSGGPPSITPVAQAAEVHHGPPMPAATDLPDLPRWDLGADLPPAQGSAPLLKPVDVPADEPLWSEKESITADDLKRPEMDRAIAAIARADHPARDAPTAPQAADPALGANATLSTHTHAALTHALAALPQTSPGALDTSALVDVLTPVLVQAIERVMWDVVPQVAQEQIRNYLREHPPSAP